MAVNASTDMPTSDAGFALSGYNHIALVCADMARTVDFYTRVLGMPLLKTLDLGGDFGQHFFFDCGGGDSIAFFWFPNAPHAVPGVAAPSPDFAGNGFGSAHASLNYLAVSVAPSAFDEISERLRAHGVATGPVTSDTGVSAASGDPRAIFFFDPDGIRIELTAREEGPGAGVAPVLPKNASGVPTDVPHRPHAAERPLVYGGDGVAA